MSAIEELALPDYQPLEAVPELEPLSTSIDPLSMSVSALEQLKQLGFSVATEILDEHQKEARVIDITELLPTPNLATDDGAESALAEVEPARKSTLSPNVIKTLSQKGDGTRAALTTHRPGSSTNKIERGSYSEIALINAARSGDQRAYDQLYSEYLGFVRLKASSYFLAGGDNDDLMQEGMLGFYKAIRDFDASIGSSFRSFADLCITRQLITAIKTATRFKHAPLNDYVSFSRPAVPDGREDEVTLGDTLPGPAVQEPPVMVISTEELQSLVYSLGTGLSPLESNALRLYLEGLSYEKMAEQLDCDTKTIDNALMRVKRKIIAHQKAREVLL